MKYRSEFKYGFRPKKNILLFPEIRTTRKIFTLTAANFFFFLNRFSGDIVFSSLVSFVCFVLLYLFAYLFVCFLKLKIHVLIHIRLCGRMSDKKNFTRPISGNRTTFFFFGTYQSWLLALCYSKSLTQFYRKKSSQGN